MGRGASVGGYVFRFSADGDSPFVDEAKATYPKGGTESSAPSCVPSLRSLWQPDELSCEVVVEKAPNPVNVVVGTPQGGAHGGNSMPPKTRQNAEISVPHALRLTSPNGQSQYEGTYFLVAGSMPNGLPLWRKRGEVSGQSDRWLYSSVHGTWNFGGDKARNEHFNCHSARIFCLQRHGGVMPHQVASWWRADVRDFVEDASVSVTEEVGVAKFADDGSTTDSSGLSRPQLLGPNSDSSSHSVSSDITPRLDEVRKTGWQQSTASASPSRAIRVQLKKNRKRQTSTLSAGKADPQTDDRARGS
jgi:hypothetical protein